MKTALEIFKWHLNNWQLGCNFQSFKSLPLPASAGAMLLRWPLATSGDHQLSPCCGKIQKNLPSFVGRDQRGKGKGGPGAPRHRCLSLAQCKTSPCPQLVSAYRGTLWVPHVIQAAGRGKKREKKSRARHCWLNPLLWFPSCLGSMVSIEWEKSELKKGPFAMVLASWPWQLI